MNILKYFSLIFKNILRKCCRKRNSIFNNRRIRKLKNFLILIIPLFILYINYTKDKYYLKLSDSIKSNSCHIAFITSLAKTSTLMDEYTNDLVYALYKNDQFNQNCSFSIYTLIWSNKSLNLVQTKFKRWSVSPIYLDNKPFSVHIKNLAHKINLLGYTSVIINYKIKLFPHNWQLVDLARNLWKDKNIYFIIPKLSSYPSLDETGAIRQMAKHSKYLILLNWHTYYSLLHAYGINESKLLYIPQSLPIMTKKSKNYYLDRILSRYNQSDFVLLIGGLMNPQENFRKLIKNLDMMFNEIPNLKLLIAGKETNSGRKINDLLVKTRLDEDSFNRITWINNMISKNDMGTLCRKVGAFLILYNETTPSMSSFLSLMNYGIPIISTPFPFAIEMIGYDRGFILPYGDDSIFVKNLVQILKDNYILNIYGQKGKNYVKYWNWINISNQYIILLKKMNNKYFNENERFKFNHALSKGLLQQTYHQEHINNLALWNNTESFSFDGQNLYEILLKNNASDGIYVVYSDFNLQLNVKLNRSYRIETVAIRAEDKFVVIDLKMGIEEFKLGKNPNNLIIIDYKKNKVIVETINVKFKVERTISQVSIEFYSLNRFTHAYGLFGSTVKRRYDILHKSENIILINPKMWLISDNDYFSHFSPGQTYSRSGINSNSFILEENDLIINETSKMSMFIEGQLFLNSGFGGVNRRMYLELYRNSDLNVFVRADRAELRSDEKSVEILLAYTLFLRQEKILKKKLKFYTMNNITISFRNSYPPKMRVAPKNTVIIIQQPWEYHGMPRYWIPYFQTTANEVWVPTQYCKNSLIANGLSADKIHVISHGVYYDKFQLDLDKLSLPTKKKFKFLTVGGLLLRKGIDVMIKAYTSVFTRNDDVTLIIHCIYSLGYNDDYIKKVQENPNSPEIVFIQEPLSEIDMIRLVIIILFL
jgi:glycosyltransferase involved in cell wall biosynthesis